MRSIYKYLVILALLVIMTSRVFSQSEHTKEFLAGVDYYSTSKYQEALNEWLKLYNAGYRSAQLDYNIGNAYFKLNNIPAAILFYERARLLKPAGDNINYNLQIARTLVVDKFQEIPQLFFVRWYDFVALVVSSNGWAVISLVSFFGFLVLLSVYIYSAKYLIKVLAFWTGIFLFVISSFTLSLTIRNRSLVYDSHKAVVFSPSVNGKSSPDPSGTDLFVLHDGSVVRVVDEVGGWYEIKLSDGNKGWVPSGTLNII
jgi:tetratricopeptide (TPR) repeat protein